MASRTRCSRRCKETFPGIDWEKQGAYFFQRVIEHGRRRSEEVREVAVTVREAGLTPWSAPGTAERQAWVADLADDGAVRRAKASDGLCPQRRLAHRGRPHPRQVQAEERMRQSRWKFEKTPGWLDWYAGPHKPRFKVPPGAVDAHCHVFGPGAEFPYRAGAQVHALRRVASSSSSRCATTSASRATSSCRPPATAPTTARWSMRCRIRGGKARGVATVKRSVTDAELQAMHDAGVRGVRFNFVKRLVDFTPKDELMEIAGRIRSWAGTS